MLRLAETKQPHFTHKSVSSDILFTFTHSTLMADRWSDPRFLPPPLTPQPRQIPYHSPYDYLHSTPPPLYANVSSSFHSSYHNPNPSYPAAAPPPETFKLSNYYANPSNYPAGNNPFAPHGGYGAAGLTPTSSLQQHTPAAVTHAAGGLGDYYYGRSGIGGGRGEAYLYRPDGNDFALKEAIRQYGADPSHLSTVSSSYVLRHQVPTGPFRPQPQIGPPHSTTQNGARKPKPKPKPKKTPSFTTNTFHCNVCNIDCNSETVFATHEQGKKHKLNLENLKGSIAQQPTNNKTEATTMVPATANKKGKTNKNSIAEKPKTNEKAETCARKPKTNKKAGTSVPGQNKRKNNDNNNDAPEEDLETKKKKVLEAGAEPSEVKVCEICNAVANSQKVFESHLSGFRHLENLKKMQGAG